jgi:hypothetical protein
VSRLSSFHPTARRNGRARTASSYRVKHEHVPVAVARVRTTLDRSIVGNGHRAGIALAAIGGEVDVREGRAAHDSIGMPMVDP